MRLFIAEKPSLARAIAEALPGTKRRGKENIVCGDGDVVAWCVGHILETAPPEAYGPHFTSWRLEHLPITPRDWKLRVLESDLLCGIEGLLRKASRVVHAGDPDREGQLLVDEVLSFLDYRGPVDRLLVRDLRPEAVRHALGALEPNARYRPLYESALARQRADWLYGMNMTRLYTLLGRAAGYDGVLSVGRVQTPVLGLIVARDRAIAEFRPEPYFVVTASVRAVGGETFRARWLPPTAQGVAAEDAEHPVRAPGRIATREIAEGIRQRVFGHSGTVTARTDDTKSEAPPLPYSLADLQVDAGRRLGLSAHAVLEACQSLYETHRLLTYPRSDCSHLPEGQHAQARDVARALTSQVPSLAASAAQADFSRRSKAWNDKKITAHHAIIPTPAAGDPVRLSDRERAIYELVGRRYLAQFHPPHEFLQSRLELEIAGERFAATGRVIVQMGWKALVTDAPDEGAGAATGESQKEEDDSESSAALPRLAPGDRVTAVDVAIADKRTKPPRPFTDASLIAAMCGVGKFVRQPQIRKVLTETDGIGTPATRAAILEMLFERGYVRRAQKTIVSTDTGRALIRALPEVATTPDMTALWELGMRAITERRQTLEAFLRRIEAQLVELVAQGKASGRIPVAPRPRDGARPRRSAPTPSHRVSRGAGRPR